MRWNTICIYVFALVLIYVAIDYYTREFHNDLVNKFQYGIPRLPTPLSIQYQIEDPEKLSQESFTFVRQDNLSPLGPSTLPKPFTPSQTQLFGQCEAMCKEKINRCLAAGNPTSCEYNYQICKQDCIWNANLNTPRS